MNDHRIFCPQFPCLPSDGFVNAGGYSRESIRQSRSFATEADYYDHMRLAHFTPKVNAPRPFVLTDANEAAA